MKLLVVDHNAVLASHRRLYAAFNAERVAGTAVVAPSVWNDHGMTFRCEPAEQGLPVFPLPCWFSGRHHRVMYRGLGRLWKRLDPDVILLNAEPENHLAAEAFLFRRTHGLRARIALISWRNIDYRETGYPYKAAGVHRWTEAFSLRHAGAIIVHNTEALRIYASYGFHRARYIAPVVDTATFAAASPALPSNGRFMIGFVGRFEQLKGGDLLVSALRHLPAACTAVMVGEGMMREAWQDAAMREGVAERVLWAGSVPHDKIPGIMRSLDVLVLPSRTGDFWKEQFGRVIIEAMAAGVAVVGSSSGEIPHAVGDAGLIVPEEDTGALVQALRTLHGNREMREQLRIRGRERVQTEFSLQAVIPQYQALLNQLAEGAA